MKSLQRSVLHKHGGPAKIPVPWEVFDVKGVAIRRQEVTMLAGVPGVGKSNLALALADQPGLRSLYHCADSSVSTVQVRLATKIANDPARNGGKNVTYHKWQIEEALETNPEWVADLLDKAKFSIGWDFTSNPSVNDVALTLRGYYDVHGVYPDAVFVDNLLDVAADSDDQWRGASQAMSDLLRLARDHNCAVIVLHHTTEAGKQEEHPPGVRDLQGKLSRVPACILTIGPHGRIAQVKARDSVQDPSGRDYFTVYADFSTMQFTDQAPTF